MAGLAVVTLYSRPGCHLCEQARAALLRLRVEYPFVLAERNIESDEALHRVYLERIPVVALDGEEVCELLLDEPALRARLAAFY